MRRYSKLTRAALSFLVIFIFLFNNTVQGLQPGQNNLSPSHNVFQPVANAGDSTGDIVFSTDPNSQFRKAILEDIKFMSSILSVAKYRLGEKSSSTFVDFYLNAVSGQYDAIQVDKYSITCSGFEENGIAYIIYEDTDTEKFYTMYVCRSDRDDILNAPGGKNWSVINKFAIFIEEGRIDAPQDLSRDMKGSKAGDANPVIAAHIRAGRVLELHIDRSSQTPALKANKVKWVEGSKPIVTTPAEYRGLKVEVTKLFTESEIKNIKEWMMSHPVRGADAKFRIVFGAAAIGWADDVEHSHIAHAGIKDGVIYMGAPLLKHIMRDEYKSLRIEILDNDEYRHLLALDHGSDQEYQKRLTKVGEVVTKLEKNNNAVWGEIGNDMSGEYSNYTGIKTDWMPMPDPVKEPREYMVSRGIWDICYGAPGKAVRDLFTSAAFQRLEENLDLPAEIFNRLIGLYGTGSVKKENIKVSPVDMIQKTLVLSEAGEGKNEAARAVQLMAAQTLTILSWIDREISGAKGIRLTADESKMVKNDKRGKSYIDKTTLSADIKEVKEEGASGFYWRGTEGIKKLGENILENAMYDKSLFDAAKNRLVMYSMDHGFIEVPKDLRKDTENGRVSTLHETFFINDLLPGFRQTTSTGPGHFQADKVDIKHVTEGRGVQFNVRYDEQGKIAEIIAQEVKTGDWCLALPGYVDYVVNLGGLRFNDISVKLSPEEASAFNLHLDFSDAEKMLSMEALTKKYATDAPYLGVMRADGPALVKTAADVPDITQNGNPGKKLTEIMSDAIEGLQEAERIYTLAEVYSEFSETGLIRHISEMIGIAAHSLVAHPALTETALAIPIVEASELGEKIKTADTPRPEPVSLGKTDGMLAFIDDNEDFLTETLGPTAKEDKLIRISVESLKAAGAKNVRDFLAAIQATAHGHVELFSTESIGEISANEYAKYGIIKDTLPAKFVRTRASVITLMPVFKDDIFATGGNRKTKNWNIGGINPKKTILSPVGLNYDKAGIARSVFLGLRLSEIAANEKYDENSDFVAYTLAQYMDLCLSQGMDLRLFDLREEDLVNIARGKMNKMVQSLNKLIRLLPIMPINAEEQRTINDRARTTLTRA